MCPPRVFARERPVRAVAPPPEAGSSTPSSSSGSPSDVVTQAERNQMEAEMRTLSPADVVKAAAAQAAAQAKKNASAAAAAARRSAEAAGAVVVVGAGGEDGALGAAVLKLFEAELREVGEKGAARVTSVYNVSLAAAKELREDDGEMRAALGEVKTLVVVPADSASGKGRKRGERRREGRRDLDNERKAAAFRKWDEEAGEDRVGC